MKTAYSLIALFGCTAMIALGETSVKTSETPDGGIQPKVVTDNKGTSHLVYYKGAADSGDLFYSQRPAGGDWTPALIVNSIKGSAVSMGTIRGAQIAVAPNGSIHVVWNGSRKALPQGTEKPPMWYAHSESNGTQFTSQLAISGDLPVDGGGAVAVDGKGAVHVYWHSVKDSEQETDRRIFQSSSQDGGKSFDAAKAISPTDAGVCACCSMQALADTNNQLYVLYRSAEANGERNICLLVSKDRGATYSRTTLDQWKLKTCPMSSMSMIETSESVLMAWESEQTIRVRGILKNGELSEQNLTLGPSKAMKHPVLARSSEGQILVVWTEGTGWNRGGSLGWQVFDSKLKPSNEVSKLPRSVSTWSFAGAFFDPKNSTFHIVH